MGLFGLFASMIGLGAMTKDGISRSISDNDAYKRAVNKGDDWYFTGNGSEMVSVKTRKRCSLNQDYRMGHWLLVDTKTGELIEDLTKKKLQKCNNEEKDKLPKCCIFYHMAGEKQDIYISDVLPGYYQHYNPKDIYHTRNIVDEDSCFYKGELCESHGNKYKHDIITFSPLIGYSMDGTLLTLEKAIEKKNKERYEDAINNGDIFWRKIIGGNFTFCKLCNPKEEPYCRHVENDDFYIYNRNKGYYIRAKKKLRKVNMAKPHHKPEYISIEEWVEDETQTRLNLDGSEWYE